MIEYNRTLYKAFIQVSDGWTYIGTFDSMYKAVKYLKKHYPGIKFDIEMEQSYDWY